MNIIHHNVRIAGSRPFRPPSQKPRAPREESWDNRFHLGKIPDYNALQDPNLKRSSVFKTRKKIVILPEKHPSRVKKTPIPSELSKCVSVKGLKKQPVMQTAILTNLFKDLESAWDDKSIPQNLREIFMNCIEKYPAKEKSAFIVKETQATKQDKSEILILVRAVQKRENLLKYLLDFAEKIAPNPSNAVKNTCVENLITLRTSSLGVVEAVFNWKRKIVELDKNFEGTEFLWEDENYLKKMTADFKVLDKTQMQRFIDLWENDPFFMHCKGERGKVEIPVEVGVIKKVREAEVLMKQEGMGEVRKILLVPQTPSKLTESRSRLILQEESKEMILSPIIGDIEEHLAQFSLLVPDSIQESMGKVENVYSMSTSLRYPAFLWAKIGEEKVGLVTLNLENQKSMHKRLFISHFSVIQHDLIERLLDLTLDHIWRNYDCIEIRVGIISKVTDQGKYEADKSIKQFFDSKGFRWKQMIYSVNQVPVQLLGLRRPEAIPAPDSANSIFNDNLELAYACAVQVSPHLSPSEVPPLHFSSLVGVSCAVKAFGEKPAGEIGETIEKLKGVPPAFRFRKDLKLEIALKDLQSLDLADEGVKGLEDDSETSVSCSALALSWVKYLPSVLNGRNFTVINSGVMRIKTGGSEAYLISTEDPQFSVFVVPGRFSGRLFEFAKECLKGISTDGEVQEIWLPRFKVYQNLEVCLEGMKISDEKVVSHCREITRFTVSTGVHPLGGFQISPALGAVVIQQEFVFAMIHHKVEEELEVPLFVVHVSEESFL
jgi:hypothetical protein